MMRIDVHHYFHPDEASDTKTMVTQILRVVQELQNEEVQDMALLDSLKAQVAATQGAIDSTKLVIEDAIATFNNILGKLQNVVDPAEIQAIVNEGKAYTDALSAEKDALATAVAQFTPPPPPPPPGT